MTLPRKHSRPITVDGLRYRWMIRARGDRLRLTVELESGAGRPITTCFREGGAITPAQVRVFIEYARERGWQPQTTRAPPKLVDFQALHAPLAELTSPDGLKAIPVAERNWVSRYPWIQDDTPRGWAYVPLGRDTAHHEIAALLATWCEQAKIPVTRDAAVVLAALPTARARSLGGGVTWIRDTELVAGPGCCATLDAWREWQTFLQDGQFFGGHDPWVQLQRVGPRIRVLPGHRGSSFDLDERVYCDLLRRVELDLEGFVARLGDWARRRAPSVAEALQEWFRAAAL